MKKPTIHFNGTKDDQATIIGRVAYKLELQERVKRVAGAPSPLIEGDAKLKDYIAEQLEAMKKSLLDIAKFCDRAKEAASVEGTLQILNERAKLIDADKIYGKIGARWTKLR